MAQSYTTDKLLADLKTRALIPTNQSTFATADLLKFADDVIQTKIVPAILSTREEYLVTSQDFVITSPNSFFSVSIPSRAIGMQLRDVQLVDASGNARGLPRLAIERSPLDQEYGFYLQGSSVIITPLASMNPTDTLRLFFFQKPSQLVETTDCGQIISIVGTVVTCSSVPSTFTSSLTYDLIQQRQGFDALAVDQTASIFGNVLTFTSLPAALQVGDWVCLSEQSPIPQVPADFHPIIAQGVAAMTLEALGFADKAAFAVARFKEMLDVAIAMINPRVDGQVKKIKSKYSLGWWV